MFGGEEDENHGSWLVSGELVQAGLGYLDPRYQLAGVVRVKTR